MGSKRLPGKVMKRIADKPILEILVERLSLSKEINKTIIATSSMGLFNTFGLFSAIMIVLSLIASMVITTAALGFMHQGFSMNEPSTQEE